MIEPSHGRPDPGRGDIIPTKAVAGIFQRAANPSYALRGIFERFSPRFRRKSIWPRPNSHVTQGHLDYGSGRSVSKELYVESGPNRVLSGHHLYAIVMVFSLKYLLPNKLRMLAVVIHALAAKASTRFGPVS